jgi:Flp pilus assembly protein CpaB
MEMEFKDPTRRRRIVFLTVGVAIAAIAGIGAFTFASNGTSPAAQVVKQPVLVASRDVPARTTLAVEDVTIRQVPIDEALSQTYREAGLVVGRVTAVPIYADQQITPNLFASSTANTDFSILGAEEEITALSPFWRAVAINVPSERAVAGEIKAGDHVDLFVSVDIEVLAVDPEGNYQRIETATEDGLSSGKSTKITFQDLEVLKAETDESLYILKVDLHQAEEIYHVVQLAPDSFSLALRPDEDTRYADTSQYGETTDRLIMQYLYPVPQLIDLSQLLGGSTVPGQSPGPGESPAPSPTPTPAP